jgi:glycine cleavage system H protein
LSRSGANPEALRFTETHEYALVDDTRAIVGLSEAAIERLGEITFVELPEVGETLSKGDTFVTLETSIGPIELTMPVSGDIVAINVQLEEEPELVSTSTYMDGWMIEVELSEPDDVNALMSYQDYQRFLND